MITRIARDALALTLLGSVALLGTPLSQWSRTSILLRARNFLPRAPIVRIFSRMTNQERLSIPKQRELIQASHPTWWSLNRQPQ